VAGGLAPPADQILRVVVSGAQLTVDDFVLSDD
jgi:hypothetical protein